MKRPTSINRGVLKDFGGEFRDSLTFQIVVVPSLLALIGVGVGDFLGEPGFAAILTIVVFVLGSSYYGWVWNRRRKSQPKFADGAETTKECEVLVFAPSIYQPSNDSRYRDLLSKLRDSWNPDHVYCLVSDAVKASKGLEVIEEVFSDRPVSQLSLGKDGHFSPSRIVELTRQAIANRSKPDQVLVDITSGTAVMSAAMYEAAREFNVNVGYLGDFETPRLILESTVESAG